MWRRERASWPGVPVPTTLGRRISPSKATSVQWEASCAPAPRAAISGPSATTGSPDWTTGGRSAESASRADRTAVPSRSATAWLRRPAARAMPQRRSSPCWLWPPTTGCRGSSPTPHSTTSLRNAPFCGPDSASSAPTTSCTITSTANRASGGHLHDGDRVPVGVDHGGLAPTTDRLHAGGADAPAREFGQGGIEGGGGGGTKAVPGGGGGHQGVGPGRPGPPPHHFVHGDLDVGSSSEDALEEVPAGGQIPDGYAREGDLDVHDQDVSEAQSPGPSQP